MISEATKLKDTFWKKSYDKPREFIKKQRYHFVHRGLYSQSYDCSSSHVQMWELNHKEGWALKSWCFWTVVLRRLLPRVSWTAGRPSQSVLKKTNPEYLWKDWYWSWSSNTLAIFWEEPTHWKRPWCWERLKAGGERDDRGWDGWVASLTQWIWVWAGSRRLWRTGKPGMLQSIGSQRVGHNWATEQQKKTKTKNKHAYKHLESQFHL